MASALEYAELVRDAQTRLGVTNAVLARAVEVAKNTLGTADMDLVRRAALSYAITDMPPEMRGRAAQWAAMMPEAVVAGHLSGRLAYVDTVGGDPRQRAYAEFVTAVNDLRQKGMGAEAGERVRDFFRYYRERRAPVDPNDEWVIPR